MNLAVNDDRSCTCCGKPFSSTKPDEKVCYDCARPGQAKTCTACGKPFKASKPETEVCFGCWYGDRTREAESDLAPLKAAFEAQGFTCEVWQTGGMCFCLAIVLSDDRNLLAGGEPGCACYEWGEGCFVNLHCSEKDTVELVSKWIRDHGLEEKHDPTLQHGSEFRLRRDKR